MDSPQEVAIMRAALTTIAFAGFSACATVPSGSAGVLLKPSGVAQETQGEGVHFIGPFAKTDVYDLRAHEQTEDLAALSADGGMIEARASVLTYHPVPAELVALDREVGPQSYEVVVRPVVRSTLRRIIAGFRADELDTPGITKAEREVTAITAQRLRPYHIVFDNISLRTIEISRLSAAYQAILDTAAEEQRALAARLLPELARQDAERRYADAQGVAKSDTAIAPTLTPAMLEDTANRAWSTLLTAPSTHVEVRPSEQPYLLEVEP
jgi:regulator of protease activity HflC (stomatin/prohibitin superfamily)